jgi:hypothetical protein
MAETMVGVQPIADRTKGSECQSQKGAPLLRQRHLPRCKNARREREVANQCAKFLERAGHVTSQFATIECALVIAVAYL